jgi:CheY-like chemotaxis protein
MQEIINWLIQVESSAHDLYKKGVNYFEKNQKLSNLLQYMSEDEIVHHQIMLDANNVIQKEKIDLKSNIVLDEKIKSKILSPFIINLKKLNENILTENEIYDCLLKTEYSEWNDIFIYVNNSLAQKKLEFQKYASIMQKHIAKLEHFFNESETLKKYYIEILKLPKIWKFKILVIDDDQMMRTLLSAILNIKHYNIDLCSSAEEGLELFEKNYYDAIICDVEMPGLNGIDFYNNINSNNKYNKKDLIFISGDTKHESFFKENKLKFIQKPFSVEEIQDEVNTILIK